MKPKTMILMILAIVCGLVASYMTSQLIAQNKETVEVLKAKDGVAQWTTLREPKEMFEVQSILKKEAPPNLIIPDRAAGGNGVEKWEDNLRGRRVKVRIEKGVILTEDQMLKKEVTGLDVQPGKRAMAVNISADRAVGFFVTAGTKVDVIHTVGGVSTVLLENILVLAIDLNVNRPEDKVGNPGSTATLQLDNTDQVLKLSSARDRGSLSLVMRPPGDDDRKSDEQPVAVAPPPPPPPPPTFDEPAPDTRKPTEVAVGTKPKEKWIDIQDGTTGVRVTYVMDKDGNVVDVRQKKFEEIHREQRQQQKVKPAPAEKDQDQDR